MSLAIPCSNVEDMANSILVTGCAGFIGSNFVRIFRQKYPQTAVIGIDNFSTGRREALDKNIAFYEGSIEDKKLLEQIFSKHKPEYVFHFAAIPRVSFSVEQPTESTKSNITGTVALLEASKNHGVKRFIFSSSSSIYGGDAPLPTKESSPASPKSPYALQKYVGEEFCRLFSKLFEMDTVVLRYFNVFGPGQYGDSPYSTVLSSWLESVFFPSGKKSYLEGNGEQSRDFCYVENVVNANLLAMESKNKFRGEAFNIANGQRTSLNQSRELIEKFTGKKVDLEMRPPRIGDVLHSHADVSLAEKVLGYKPTVNFEEGLKRTIEWYRNGAV